MIDRGEESAVEFLVVDGFFRDLHQGIGALTERQRNRAHGLDADAGGAAALFQIIGREHAIGVQSAATAVGNTHHVHFNESAAFVLVLVGFAAFHLFAAGAVDNIALSEQCAARAFAGGCDLTLDLHLERAVGSEAFIDIDRLVAGAGGQEQGAECEYDEFRRVFHKADCSDVSGSDYVNCAANDTTNACPLYDCRILEPPNCPVLTGVLAGAIFGIRQDSAAADLFYNKEFLPC